MSKVRTDDAMRSCGELSRTAMAPWWILGGKVALKTTTEFSPELSEPYSIEVKTFLRFLHHRNSHFSMAKLFNGYRHIENIEPCAVDDEEHALAFHGPINNAERSWSHYRTNPMLFMLLVLSVTLNVTTNVQLHRQRALNAEATRSKFGKM